MSRFHDFDAAWSAVEVEAPTIVVFGEKVQLPEQVPAATVLMQARWQEDDSSAKLTSTRLVELLRTIVGDHIDEWVAKGLGSDQLLDLYVGISAVYREDDSGEAEAPATGATVSSSDG